MPQACNFTKKETLYRCFPVNFAKFQITPFLQNTSGRLFLNKFSAKKLDFSFNIEQLVFQSTIYEVQKQSPRGVL